MSEQLDSCADEDLRSKLEVEEQELKDRASQIIEEIASLDNSYQQNKADLHEKTKALVDSRQVYSEKVNSLPKAKLLDK